MGHAARAGGPEENEERLKLSICKHLMTGYVETARNRRTGKNDDGRRMFFRFDPWDTLKRSLGRDARTVPRALRPIH
jgi:hypothetical protein